MEIRRKASDSNTATSIPLVASRSLKDATIVSFPDAGKPAAHTAKAGAFAILHSSVHQRAIKRAAFSHDRNECSDLMPHCIAKVRMRQNQLPESEVRPDDLFDVKRFARDTGPETAE